MKIYTERGIEYRESEPSEGFALCWERHPGINEETYAYQEAIEIGYVLWEKGIEYENRPILRKNMCPSGSGPRGRVRFGDDMMATIQRIFVRSEYLSRALMAIQEHDNAVKQWLHHGGPMPQACKI